MLMLQRMMNHPERDPDMKVKILQARMNISALIGNITHGSDDWIIDNGASKHMTRFKESFMKLLEHESPHKVKLGDYYQYPIKGSGKSSYKLNSRKSLTMKEVLFVPRLKKNILSISALDAK